MPPKGWRKSDAKKTGPRKQRGKLMRAEACGLVCEEPKNLFMCECDLSGRLLVFVEAKSMDHAAAEASALIEKAFDKSGSLIVTKRGVIGSASPRGVKAVRYVKLNDAERMIAPDRAKKVLGHLLKK